MEKIIKTKFRGIDIELKDDELVTDFDSLEVDINEELKNMYEIDVDLEKGEKIWNFNECGVELGKELEHDKEYLVAFASSNCSMPYPDKYRGYNIDEDGDCTLFEVVEQVTDILYELHLTDDSGEHDFCEGGYCYRASVAEIKGIINSKDVAEVWKASFKEE